jgi:MerR family transcriptional regulator, light-induced transcriptional regulator
MALGRRAISVGRRPFRKAHETLARKDANRQLPSKSRSTPTRSVLARAIQVEVLPRIVLARRAIPACAAARREDRSPFSPQSIAEFAALVLAAEVDALSDYIDAIHRRGASLERLYLDLLAPAARQLEDLGTADLFALTEATIGLGRLQRLLHRLNPAFEDEGDRKWQGRHALIMPASGEQNTFDLFIIGAWLRRAGWEVSSWPLVRSAELFDIVRQQPFALVWFSASSENRLSALAASIRRVRRASQNPDVGVMVGGRLFLRRPELVALVGADATAVDGRQTVLQAANLLGLLPSMAEERPNWPAEPAVAGLEPAPLLEKENAAE